MQSVTHSLNLVRMAFQLAASEKKKKLATTRANVWQTKSTKENYYVSTYLRDKDKHRHRHRDTQLIFWREFFFLHGRVSVT